MKILPDRPNLEFLRREAQTLKSRHRARDASVCDAIGHFDTSMHGLSHDAIFAAKFSINDAQRVTARQYCFASWTRLKQFVQKSTYQSKEFNPVLSANILKRKIAYDELLHSCKQKKWKDGAVGDWDDFNKESGDIFEDIYQQYGWPGPNIIGRNSVEACFYLAGSNVYDSDFQLKTANLMKESLPKGECFGVFYASLIDRYLALTYQPSSYGTMSDYNEETGRVELTRNISDLESLNVRRAKVGLGDFNSDNKKLVKECIANGVLETDKNKWESYKRKTALKGGYITE